ncbi:unnamed protein product, partial [Amoebophrya sp. A25]
ASDSSQESQTQSVEVVDLNNRNGTFLEIDEDLYQYSKLYLEHESHNLNGMGTKTGTSDTTHRISPTGTTTTSTALVP